MLSIYGTNDPYADDKIIRDTQKYLPKDTRYVAIEGGVHAHFGDYTQPGDGEPSIDQVVAEKQIIKETLSYIEDLLQKQNK